MSKMLTCCTACRRHVLATAFVCPFCEGSVKACQTPYSLERTAWVGASLLLGAALFAGCMRTPPTVALYGAAPPIRVSPSPSPSPSPESPPST